MFCPNHCIAGSIDYFQSINTQIKINVMFTMNYDFFHKYLFETLKYCILNQFCDIFINPYQLQNKVQLHL